MNTACCTVRLTLKDAQDRAVEELAQELRDHEENGNEYYAVMTRKDLLVARSPARLVHKCNSTTI